jgi:hypothetical protein
MGPPPACSPSFGPTTWMLILCPLHEWNTRITIVGACAGVQPAFGVGGEANKGPDGPLFRFAASVSNAETMMRAAC